MARVALINTNEMTPPIAPIGIDYIAGALHDAGHDVEVLDLCFADDAEQALRDYFATQAPRAVGLSFRNTDDCFWPGQTSFIPRLKEIVLTVRGLTDAPVVLGGVGFSLMAAQILAACGADHGMRGDGEIAWAQFVDALERGDDFDEVAGLVWRDSETGSFSLNPPARTRPSPGGKRRAWVDNPRYFREGGQMGVETKRGCDRACIYCADPVGKGAEPRLRDPQDVADEFENLVAAGIDVFHLCDCEFNVPYDHAVGVCDALIARGLGSKMRWYTYMAVVDFDEQLARRMREAGCIGINFGADSASETMLAFYRKRHRKDDIESAVRLCKLHGIRVMLDLLIGGPGETEATVRESVEFMKRINPDCVGAALGVRVYPGTPFAQVVAQEGFSRDNPNLNFSRIAPAGAFGDDGQSIEERLLYPVYYIASSLGDRPAQRVKDIIAGDERFFEPMDEQGLENYNYNDNQPLVDAIRNGARGAYWDILQRMRTGS